MSDAHAARLDAAPRFTESGRSANGLYGGFYRPTSDEADVIAKGRHELSTHECTAQAEALAAITDGAA